MVEVNQKVFVEKYVDDSSGEITEHLVLEKTDDKIIIDNGISFNSKTYYGFDENDSLYRLFTSKQHILDSHEKVKILKAIKRTIDDPNSYDGINELLSEKMSLADLQTINSLLTKYK